MATATSEATTFFTLPQELRDQIYDNYIEAVADSEASSPMLHFSIAQFEVSIKRLAKAVPEIRDELLARFYGGISKHPFRLYSWNGLGQLFADNMWCPKAYHPTVLARLSVDLLKYDKWAGGTAGMRLRDTLQVLCSANSMTSGVPFQLSQKLSEALKIRDLLAGEMVTITLENKPFTRMFKVQGSAWHVAIGFPQLRGNFILMEGNLDRIALLHRCI